MSEAEAFPTAVGDVTRLLLEWRQGRLKALDELLPLVYDELRRLASGYLRGERANHTFETSALVHEAYFRLIDQNRVDWHNRAHFFAIAARMMRRILVDRARHHHYAKRGGGMADIPLDEVLATPAHRPPDLVALDDALLSLERTDETLARLVELKYFGGLTAEEIAEVLDLSTATVTRRWRAAKAWLYEELI